jgi:hypothetical protein
MLGVGVVVAASTGNSVLTAVHAFMMSSLIRD